MPIYTEATPTVLRYARELIKEYHPFLIDARIGFVFRDEAPETDGRVTLAKVKKVTPEPAVYLDLDFVIWIAQDQWQRLNIDQRKALIDHELCHCTIGPNGWKVRGHEIEEFNCIIERWGLWWPSSDRTKDAIQTHFDLPDLPRKGSVRAVDPAAMQPKLGGEWTVSAFKVESDDEPDPEIWDPAFPTDENSDQNSDDDSDHNPFDDDAPMDGVTG